MEHSHISNTVKSTIPSSKNHILHTFNSLRPSDAYVCQYSKLTIICSDNAGILLIWNLRAKFSETLGEIHTFSFKKMHLNMTSAKWRPFSLGHSVLKSTILSSQCSGFVCKEALTSVSPHACTPNCYSNDVIRSFKQAPGTYINGYKLL